MNPDVSISIILEERLALKNNLFAVKLRITHHRKQRYYKTGISVTKEEFTKLMIGNPKGTLKDKRLYINAFEQKAVEAIDSLKEFSFAEFKKNFVGDTTVADDAFYLLQEYSDKLWKEGRIKSAACYRTTLHSLQKFTSKKRLPLLEIDATFLKEFEKWMLDKGKSITTVGIYLRPLRTIFNLAIRERKSSLVDYPFGRHRYQIPAGRNIKKALTINDIQRIFDCKPDLEAEDKAKDFWILSYLCNGINMKDVARLKFSNINGDMIYFVRAKTENTSRSNIKTISVYMTDEVKKIISKWRNRNNYKPPGDYVFPILEPNITPEDERKRVDNFIQITNKHLKRVGERLNLPVKLTTYTARHSFATVLKRSGAPLAYISDSLGHSNSRTTENYFDGFEDDVKKQYAALLTNFKTN